MAFGQILAKLGDHRGQCRAEDDVPADARVLKLEFAAAIPSSTVASAEAAVSAPNSGPPALI